MMPVRTPRRAATRTPQQITEQLRQLVQNDPELYSLEDADQLLDELLAVRPDLRERT